MTEPSYAARNDLMSAPPSVPYVADAPFSAGPTRSLKRLIVPIIAGIIILSLTALSTYLWAVHSQWVSQNDELRTEALAIGEELAVERATVAELEAELDIIQNQLANATTKISELADIEANAVDARNVLVELGDAFVECVNLQDEIIDAYRKGYPYSINSSAVKERVDYCNSVKKSFRDFKKDVD